MKKVIALVLFFVVTLFGNNLQAKSSNFLPKFKVIVKDVQYLGVKIPPCDAKFAGKCTMEFEIGLFSVSGGSGSKGLVGEENGRHYLDCILETISSDFEGDGTVNQIDNNFSSMGGTLTVGNNIFIGGNDSGWSDVTVNIVDVPFDTQTGRFRIYLD